MDDPRISFFAFIVIYVPHSLSPLSLSVRFCVFSLFLFTMCSADAAATDTYASGLSWDAALHAAGAVCLAVDYLASGTLRFSLFLLLSLSLYFEVFHETSAH